MGKASRRRKERRKAYLADLAERDPERFAAEWTKRLRSWSKEVNIRLDQDAPLPWMATDGQVRDPRAFALVEEALALLAECGQAALDREGEATREILADWCSRAVSRSVDPRMYRLSSARSNREHMQFHNFSLPH